MANETGDMKILGNFRRLIDLVTPSSPYTPTNLALTIANMEALLAATLAVNDIGVKIAPNKIAIDERQAAYLEVKSLVRGSRSMLKASGASQAIVDDADTFARKVLGLRKSPKAVDDPNTPENEALQSHSASQQSYDAMLGNFRTYIEILKNEPQYAPNELKYQTAELEKVADELVVKNNAVSSTFVPLNNARSVREDKLYTGENNICDVAAMVKAYIKAVHGPQSDLYKQVNALSFKRTFR